MSEEDRASGSIQNGIYTKSIKRQREREITSQKVKSRERVDFYR